MRLLTVVDRSDVVSESVDALDQFARPSNIQNGADAPLSMRTVSEPRDSFRTLDRLKGTKH